MQTPAPVAPVAPVTPTAIAALGVNVVSWCTFCTPPVVSWGLFWVYPIRRSGVVELPTLMRTPAR